MTESRSTDVQWLADDLTKVEAMANELEAYIVAGEVYHTLLIPTDNGNRKMTMSGGDLLARIKRLREHMSSLSADQQTRLTTSAAKVQSTIYSLRSRFHDLLRRELKARRDQLSWNEDIRRAKSEPKADPAEIQNRHHIVAIQEELNQA
jgi:hypothetical protein